MLDTTIEALKFMVSPTDFLIKKFSQASAEAPRSTELSELQKQAQLREVEMRISEAEAKVAQELAIAKRIENAEEVEMTEFYEYAGEGTLGVKYQNEALAVGTSGSGRRVSKRKFVFKGGSSLSAMEDLAKAVEASE